MRPLASFPSTLPSALPEAGFILLVLVLAALGVAREVRKELLEDFVCGEPDASPVAEADVLGVFTFLGTAVPAGTVAFGVLAFLGLTSPLFVALAAVEVVAFAFLAFLAFFGLVVGAVFSVVLVTGFAFLTFFGAGVSAGAVLAALGLCAVLALLVDVAGVGAGVVWAERAVANRQMQTMAATCRIFICVGMN